MTARKPKTQLPEQVTINRKRYYDLGDTRLPSVTTVLDVALNKPALPAWAARTVAEQAMQWLPRLVKASRTAEGRDDAVKWLKGRPYAQRDEAAAAGTAAHAIAEAHTLGQPYQVPDPDTDAGKTLLQFLKFMDDWRPQFEASEAVVVNRSIGYAGTLDAICRLPGLDNRLLVVDYKTSRTGPYGEWALQIAAYARAETLWLRNGETVDMPHIDGAVVLRLRPNFYALHKVDADLDHLLDVFGHALHLSQWALDASSDGAFGKALPVPAPIPQEVA